VRVWIATGHTDMRKGMPGLALLVQEHLKRDPHAGALIKIIWHDGLGMSLYAKRLDRGRFVWPKAQGGAVALTSAQLGYMLDGIDWRNPQHTWRPASAG
jgi:transposase